MGQSIWGKNVLNKQTIYFACLSNIVALKGGAIKKEQSLSADMATIMGNLYMAHCVRIYEEHYGVGSKFTDLVIEKILNENICIFNRVINNSPYSFMLRYMIQQKNEKYGINNEIIEELKSNAKIKNKLVEGVYIPNKLLLLDMVDKNSEEYEALYQDVISVGEYDIADVGLTQEMKEYF